MSLPPLPSPEGLCLTAPTKLNLHLRVGRAKANGRHDLASLVVALDQGDRLQLRRSPRPLFTRSVADDALAPLEVNWPVEADLAWRAWQALERAVNRPLPTEVQLLKRVPPGLGLGAGSGDAAAVLVGLRRLWGLPLDRSRLLALGAELGGDVPVLVDALLGQSASLMTGEGERLEPAPAPSGPWLLALPPLHAATGAVYGTFDRLGGGARDEDLAATAQALRAGSLSPRNDLTAAACATVPELEPWMARLRSAAPELTWHLTGSGAAFFAAAPRAPEAAALAAALTQATGCPTVAASRLPRPVFPATISGSPIGA